MELLKALFLFFVFFISIVVSVIGIVNGIAYIDCTSFSRATGIVTKYDFGCYAYYNDKWVPNEVVYGKKILLQQENN